MDAFEQARFDDLYPRHLRALKLQGKAPATIDGYARALRRAAAHFDRCPDQLSVEDFQSYFAGLIDYDTDQRNVTFRYRDAQSQTIAYRTLPLVDFLSCVLQHVRPGGLCRVRH